MTAQPGDQPTPSDDSGTQSHYGAVRQLFREHNNALLKFLYARVSSAQEARDLAQEAYVRLLQLDRPESVSFLRGYLFRIAANLTIDRGRRQKFIERLPPDQFPEIDDLTEEPEQAVMTRQEFRAAWQALQELDPNIARAVYLRFVEDQATSEIALIMKIDERTVRKYLTRGLVHCRTRLGFQPGRS